MLKYLCVLCLVVCSAGNSLAEDSARRLSLGDAIKLAVEKNLDVRAELYNPAQFEADIQRNKAIYDPLLSLQTSYGETNSASASVLGSPSVKTKELALDASLSQLFWTGGTLAAFFNNAYTSTNASSTLGSYWQTSAGFSLSQPLLKNFGRENTELNILVSRLSKFGSLEHFNSRLVAVVSQVRVEYFKLYSLRETLETRKTSLELARKILSETQARVKAGVLPAMEILNAEFGVASREKDLNDAEKAVRDQVDVINLLLQLPSGGDLLITDAPRRDNYDVKVQEETQKALNRPDIRELKRNLDIAELQTRVYRNKSLPDLTLNASTALTGLDRTYPRDMDKVGTFDYPVWSIGLNLAYPLGNNAADNDYRKSRLKSEQIALQIRSLEESAINDVRTAVRAIAASFKQIEVTDRGRAFAEERLRSFIRKNEVGLATTKDVLDVENDLNTAKNNQVQALVDYNNAITRLWQVTGEVLERDGIRVVEGDADRLYKNIH